MERRRVGASDRGTRGEVDPENDGASLVLMLTIPFETGVSLGIKKNLFPLGRRMRPLVD